ncbi:MAG: hypothetical protein RR049_02160 [Angelakisella sp.]
MLYQHGDMVLEKVGTGLRGTVNDVFICRDIGSVLGTLYTLVVIYDRECAKQMTALLEEPRGDLREEKPYLAAFTVNEQFCYIFPYREERRLSTFAAGQLLTSHLNENCCINIVMECLSTLLPYPLLYLVLTQNDLHIEKDGTVYFSYCFDLAKLDVANDEKACVTLCARRLLELLTTNAPKKRKKLKSFTLLQKRANNGSYDCFPELYRDIRITAVDPQKQSWRKRLLDYLERNKDSLFRIMLVVCAIMVVLTLLIIGSQALFGDIPIFRLLKNGFEVIGTRSMK